MTRITPLWTTEITVRNVRGNRRYWYYIIGCNWIGATGSGLRFRESAARYILAVITTVAVWESSEFALERRSLSRHLKAGFDECYRADGILLSIFAVKRSAVALESSALQCSSSSSSLSRSIAIVWQTAKACPATASSQVWRAYKTTGTVLTYLSTVFEGFVPPEGKADLWPQSTRVPPRLRGRLGLASPEMVSIAYCVRVEQ